MATKLRPRGIRAEIRQRRPFQNRAQEATIALLRTASVVGRALERVIEPSGLSLAQYNALRIIRGAGPDGIASLAIRKRMIEEGTTITRILDKLENSRMIARRGDERDRRLVLCHITGKGRALLTRLEPAVDEADREATGGLSEAELADFITRLDTIRAHNAARGAPRHRPSKG